MATVDTNGCKALKPGKHGKALIIFSPILHLASKVTAEQIKSHQ